MNFFLSIMDNLKKEYGKSSDKNTTHEGGYLTWPKEKTTADWVTVVGENLIKYYETEDSGTVYYYDKDSVKGKSGIVTVLTKTRYYGKNKEWGDLVDGCIEHSKLNSINDCNKLSSMKNLYEINCKEDTYRILEIILYDEYVKVINEQSEPTKLFLHIIPNSVMEELKNRVCE